MSFTGQGQDWGRGGRLSLNHLQVLKNNLVKEWIKKINIIRILNFYILKISKGR